MKKILLFVSMVFALIAIPASVYAVTDPLAGACDPALGTSNSAACQGSATNPISGKDGIVLKAANIITYLTGAISIIIIMISGFNYITSNGDSNKVGKAKSALIYAAVGLAITVSAQIIILFVVGKI
jgi:hypothetical protein